jgi:hypothetical protein
MIADCVMNSEIPLTGDDIAWINSYATEVRGAFGAEFRATADRFEPWECLLKRFTKNGWG